MKKLINKYAVEIVAGVACVILFVFGVYVFNAFWHMAHAIAIVGIGLLAWNGKKSWAKEKRIKMLLTALLSFYSLVYAVTAIGGAEAATIAVKGVLLSFALTMCVAIAGICVAKTQNWADVCLKASLIILLGTLALFCMMLLCNIIPSELLVKTTILLEAGLAVLFFYQSAKKSAPLEEDEKKSEN